MVLGVSFDARAENAAFAERQGYDFPLLCDTEREMGMAYGACDTRDDAYARRITYVIDDEGKIAQAIDTKNPGDQAAALIDTL